MNELFGNRENVKPDYLISSIDNDMVRIHMLRTDLIFLCIGNRMFEIES